MKIKLRSFLLFFYVVISLITTSFSSYSQKFDWNTYPKNSTIYLSSDSLKSLYLNSGEFLQSSKYDLEENLIDPFGNKYVLTDKASSKKLIERINQMNYNFYKVQEAWRIERYKAQRNEFKI